MSTPTISVTIPCFNAEAFIRDSLGSVQRAVAGLPETDRDRIEVIVCDNHSTDQSREIAEGFDLACAHRVIQPPRHYENRTDNWHYAITSTGGTWVQMLHADDLLAPGALAGILRAIASSRAESAVLLSGRIRTFTDPGCLGRLRPLWPFPSLLRGAQLRRKVLPFLCPFVPFTPMRRSTYDQVGGLNSKYELVQDLDLWMRMLKKGDALYWPIEMGYWRNHPFSPRYAQTFAREHMLFANCLQQTAPELPPLACERVAQLAYLKASLWLGSEEADGLAREAGGMFTNISATPRDREGIETMLRMSERTIGMLLYWLRGKGLLAFV